MRKDYEIETTWYTTSAKPRLHQPLPPSKASSARTWKISSSGQIALNGIWKTMPPGKTNVRSTRTLGRKKFWNQNKENLASEEQTPEWQSKRNQFMQPTKSATWLPLQVLYCDCFHLSPLFCLKRKCKNSLLGLVAFSSWCEPHSTLVPCWESTGPFPTSYWSPTLLQVRSLFNLTCQHIWHNFYYGRWHRHARIPLLPGQAVHVNFWSILPMKKCYSYLA